MAYLVKILADMMEIATLFSVDGAVPGHPETLPNLAQGFIVVAHGRSQLSKEDLSIDVYDD
jgi:hypothetical protein